MPSLANSILRAYKGCYSQGKSPAFSSISRKTGSLSIGFPSHLGGCLSLLPSAGLCLLPTVLLISLIWRIWVISLTISTPSSEIESWEVWERKGLGSLLGRQETSEVRLGLGQRRGTALVIGMRQIMEAVGCL